MKKIKFLAIFFISIFSFISCEDDTSLEYIAQPQGEFAFSNSFLSEYVLIPAASNNIGERFTWDAADFGTPTNITYELQSSVASDFSTMEVVGTTSENEYALTIGDLLNYANQAGLDNDPETTDIPNTGSVYFRLRAFAGSDSDTEILTSTQALTLTLPENTGSETGPVCELEYLWAVGAGLPDAGWDWATPVSLACLGDGVYGWNVNLQNNGGVDNNFRFFTSEGDWGSGQNYPYYFDEGYDIDDDLVDAADNDNNFAFTGVTGYYYLEVDTANKTITLSDPQPTGDCEYDQLWGVGDGLADAGWNWTTPARFICSGDGIYSSSVNLTTDIFRFFTSEGDWDSGLNYPYFIDEGFSIDTNFEENAGDNDSNFRFIGTPGMYLLTIDTVAKTITLE